MGEDRSQRRSSHKRIKVSFVEGEEEQAFEIFMQVTFKRQKEVRDPRGTASSDGEGQNVYLRGGRHLSE